VNERSKPVGGQQRVVALVVANAAAAVGAGWVAKQPAWAQLNRIPSLLARPEGGSLWSRIGTAGMATLETTGRALAESIRPPRASAQGSVKVGYALAVASQVAAWGYAAFILAKLPGKTPAPPVNPSSSVNREAKA